MTSVELERGRLDASARTRNLEIDFNGKISLANGYVKAKTDRWETESVAKGLKIVVIGDGELRCKLPNCPQTALRGPCICAIWNNGQSEGMQSFLPGCIVPYTIVTLSATIAEQQIAGNFDHLRSIFGMDDDSQPHLSVAPLTDPVRGLSAQITACPLKGFTRGLYLSGKALEIAALALTAFDPIVTPHKPRLSTADIEKLYFARDLLVQRLQSPPSLAELSLAVGINVRKLKSGFQQVFGASVYSYLQELRLETAYRLLVEGEMNVSSAAYHVGYAPAHFSVAFRKRFGVSPKHLRI